MLKDLGGGSLEVKGSIETARDRETECRRSPGKHLEQEGVGKVLSVLTTCQAASQMPPYSHIFLIPLT